MTIVLLGLGALASAAGTRAALVLFVGAAISGALDDSLPALSVWTAAMLAGLVLRPGLAARRLAPPALGAGAVLVAASSSNAAAVVGLWVVGTAVVCFGRGHAPESRRWALMVCLADIPLAGAVIYNAVDAGFEAWPPGSGSGAAIAMLVSAALRLPLAAGSDDENEETALVVVRTQAAALILVALRSGGLGIAEGVLVVAAVAFALAGLVGSRAATRDSAQELSLVAMAAAGSVLGWTPDGWVWGALAAGTLIHHLRVSSRGSPLNVLVAGVLRGAGLGLPFLPVVAALLEGSLRAGSWYGAVTAIACLLGLALRARPEAPDDAARRRKKARDLAAILRFSWLALAVLAGLTGVVLAVPRPPAGDVLSWPPLWAAAVVGVCGLIGARFPRFAPRSQDRPGRRGVPIQAWRPMTRVVAPLERVARTRALEASLALLVVTGVVLWAAGILRGFL